MEVYSSPFLNQEDYFTNFCTLFSETEEQETFPNKRPKLETSTLIPPFFSSDEELALNNSLAMSDYFEFDNSYAPYRSVSDPETSPGSTSSFHFQPLAGSSGHIHLLEPVQQEKIQVKRARSEPEPEPVRTGQHRRLWVKNRSKAWWEEVNRPDYPESEFVKAFRMSKATFELVCNELESAVTKKDTMLRQAIPVRQRVAVCIYRLATGEPLRVVSKRFGLGISTCHKLILEVCSAIKTVLMPKFLQWPGPEKIPHMKKAFSNLSGLPDVVGAMYTTHIPIIAPKVSVEAYFNKKHTERNQKTSYTITVQGVVGPDGVFTDVLIGLPGSMSDDKILENSALYQRAAKGDLRDGWIVGNRGYQLTDWMLTPYVHKNLTWAQHGFNEKMETVERLAKEAFGRLKGRWSCLQKRTEVKLQDLPAMLGACCVLHNICEMRGEPQMTFEVFDDVALAEGGVRSLEATQARDQIAHHLLHHNFH